MHGGKPAHGEEQSLTVRELLSRAKSCLDLTDEERGRHTTDYEIRFMELARIHQKV